MYDDQYNQLEPSNPYLLARDGIADLMGGSGKSGVLDFPGINHGLHILIWPKFGYWNILKYIETLNLGTV